MDPFDNLNKMKISEQKRFDMAFFMFEKLYMHSYKAHRDYEGKHSQITINTEDWIKEITEETFDVVDTFIDHYLKEHVT